MSELTKIRMQILNAETDEVLEEVDVLSSASSILFPDGKNLEEKISQIESKCYLFFCLDIFYFKTYFKMKEAKYV